MSHVSAPGRRPPELEDADWLRARYVRDGDMQIALDLGVSRKTVRLARERLGITSMQPGRRRGATPRQVDVTRDAITARLDHERTLELPATWQFLLERVRNGVAAHYAQDQRGELDALTGIASACGLVLDHLQALEAA